MYLGDINVAETPEKLPPLPLGTSQRRWLRKYITTELSKAGADGEALMSYFTKEKMLWEIPPLYTPDVKNEGLILRPMFSLRKRMSVLNDAYLATAFNITTVGLTEEALAPLAQVCGAIVLHPMTFSRESDPVKANFLFDVEFVVFVSKSAENVVIRGDTVACKMYRHYTLPYIGVKDGVFQGREVSDNEFHEYLYFARGTARFPTSDLYDRLYSWVGSNYAALGHADSVLKAISLLKFTQSQLDYYSFEQMIVNLQPFQDSKITMRASLFTDDAFEEIREVWLQVDQPMTDRANQVFKMLVPAYMDATQFKKIFGCDPTAKTQSRYFEQRMISGMDNFNGIFMQTQREIREGRFIGMTG